MDSRQLQVLRALHVQKAGAAPDHENLANFSSTVSLRSVLSAHSVALVVEANGWSHRMLLFFLSFANAGTASVRGLTQEWRNKIFAACRNDSRSKSPRVWVTAALGLSSGRSPMLSHMGDSFPNAAEMALGGQPRGAVPNVHLTPCHALATSFTAESPALSPNPRSQLNLRLAPKPGHLPLGIVAMRLLVLPARVCSRLSSPRSS
jgi:hypothetical protein